MADDHEATPTGDAVDELRFRDVLGNFATGVTIITANDNGEQVGMSANSFTSVSLDPPLVAFCAAHTSTTYPRIQRAGHFCVNVLAEEQADIGRLFRSAGSIASPRSPGDHPTPGAAIIEGDLAWLDCTIEAEHLSR